MADTPLPDDHADKWIYKKHTRAKHDVLHYYLKVWTSIVSNPNYPIRIFDCFAGRGDYVDSDGASPKSLDNISSDVDFPGSPILILDALSEHAENFKRADCYFMEPSKRNRDHLLDSLDKTSYPNNVKPHPVNGSFPDDLPNLISKTGGKRGFAFFFIDPFNIQYLDFDKIVDVAGTQRFDCLITVMTSQLIRWQDSEAHQDGYKQFFGMDNWRSEIEQFTPKQLSTREAEFYCNRLEEHGPEYTLAYMTTDGDSRRLKYHLVFTTNDAKGIEAMKGSMMRCGGDYTLAYAPKRAEVSHDQQTIQGGVYLTDADREKGWLLSRFKGEVVQFDEIVERALTERRYQEALRKDYRKYIKQLHNDGVIEIPGREKPDGSLPKHLEIIFPNNTEEIKAV